MSADRHHRMSDLFLRAAEMPPENVSAFLDQHCSGDPHLRAEIEQMLAHDREQTAFLEQPALGSDFRLSEAAAAPAAQGHRALPLPANIASYTIQGVLGEGGMGVVYRAAQVNPPRPVALKVLRAGAASPSAIRRFEIEAQVLARLAHPNIAHIYEAGFFDDGNGRQPFLAMELVEGETLPEYVAKRNLNARQRIELILQVCDAVEHAHQRGVIHRDLKPANMLVDEAGRVKVLDFGIARVMADDWQVSLVTGAGQVLGTLSYMSPEQLAIDGNDRSADIDTRSDVYGLGIVLYELLTGTLPHDIRGKPLAQAIDILHRQDPLPLEKAPSPVFISGRGRSELGMILTTCLERDRHRRYQSVAAFAADLRHYLAGEPISARPQTTLYQLRKFAFRHRQLVAAAAAAFVVLVLSVVGLAKYSIDTSRARAAAVEARDEARARSADLEQVAAFQAAMVSDIDVHLMGIRLREDLIDEFRTVHAHSDALDQLQAEFERHLAGINFTTAAQKGLERTVFQRAFEAIQRDLSDQPLVKAQLLQSVADALESLDLPEQAMATQQQALAIRRELLGDEHPATLTSVLAMGYLLVGLQRFDEAEALYNEALQGRRIVLGEDHPDTALAKRRLANLYWITGRSDEAVEFGVAALESLRRTLGDDDPRTIDAMHTMGPLMHGIGDFEAALAYTTAALDGRRRILGEDHPDTLISLNNTGVILRSMGRTEQAMGYLHEAMVGRLRVLGRNHRLTRQTMMHVARGLAELGRHEESEQIMRDVQMAEMK